MAARTVVLYCTHLLTEEILREFDRLSRELEPDYDVVLLLDADSCPLNRMPISAFEFRHSEVLKEFGRHMDGPGGGSLMPGCLDLAVLYYARRNPDYEYYWRIEYDVRFSGAWGEFFSAFEQNDADLLTALVQTKRERPNWGWWPTLSVPPGVDAKSVMPIRAFHPVCRISGTGLLAIEGAYENGWKGHYEVTLPTILHHYGHRIEDFGGEGSFVAAGNTGRFYSNVPRANGRADGSFVWRPCRSATGKVPNKLWHPVKQYEEEAPHGPQIAQISGRPELNQRSTTDLIRAFVRKALKKRIRIRG